MTDAATVAIVYVVDMKRVERTTSDGIALVFVCNSGVKLLQLFESRSRFRKRVLNTLRGVESGPARFDNSKSI
jgi:hypothetical protein